MADLALQSKRSKPLPQRVCKLLAEEGFRPQLVNESDAPVHVVFKVEGKTFLIRFEENDERFLQVCAGVLLEGTTKDELTLLRAAQAIQAETKVAKVFLPPDLEFVEFQVEVFVPDRGICPEILGRCIGTIQAAWAMYFDNVTPELPRALA